MSHGPRVKVKTIGFRASEEMTKAIEAYCWEHHLRLSDMLRQAAEEYMERHDGWKEPPQVAVTSSLS
jgi:hypothetical protein